MKRKTKVDDGVHYTFILPAKHMHTLKSMADKLSYETGSKVTCSDLARRAVKMFLIKEAT